MRRAAAIIAVLVAAAVVAVLIVVHQLQRLCSAGSGTYQVRAIFDNASFAVPGEDVESPARNVGRSRRFG